MPPVTQVVSGTITRHRSEKDVESSSSGWRVKLQTVSPVAGGCCSSDCPLADVGRNEVSPAISIVPSVGCQSMRIDCCCPCKKKQVGNRSLKGRTTDGDRSIFLFHSCSAFHWVTHFATVTSAIWAA